MLAVERQATETFTDREERLLLRLADHAAIALRNAQLYQEAERRRKEAEVLAELAGSIGGARDLGEVLQRVVEGAHELTGSDLAHIALMEPGSGAMVFRYWAGERYHGAQGYRVVLRARHGGQSVGHALAAAFVSKRTPHLTERAGGSRARRFVCRTGEERALTHSPRIEDDHALERRTAEREHRGSARRPLPTASSRTSGSDSERPATSLRPT